MTAQVGYGPLERIDGPLPIPPLHGLLAAAAASLITPVRIVVDTDERGIDRWINGAEVFPYPTDEGGLFDTCGLGSDPAEKDFGGSLPHPQFGAFTAYLAETCTSYKVWNQEQYQARAIAALTAVESSIIARQLMYGEGILLNPHLADGNGVYPLNNAATSPEYALQLLEEQIALSGRQGLIHCSPMMATALLGSGFALSDKTGAIRTINGIVVVPDFGYAGQATPPGHAAPGAGEEWAFATGPVDIRRSEMFIMPERVEEALDRGSGGATTGRSNSITYRAERYYLVTWDTAVQAAVLVDRCQTTC